MVGATEVGGLSNDLENMGLGQLEIKYNIKVVNVVQSWSIPGRRMDYPLYKSD